MMERSAVSGQQADEEQILTESGFYWRERDGVKVLVSSALEAAGFLNGFSTRLGGVSPFPENSLNLAGFHEDTTKNITENRRRFLAALGVEMQLATVWQVHGDTVKNVAAISDVEQSETRADAIVSNLEGVLAGVKTADCVPVLIGDTGSGAFAAVHAGWRGTVRSIAAKAVRTMGEAYGSRPADLIAAIGPAASCERYEVGQDVIDEFSAQFGSSGDKYLAVTRDGHALVDLHAANRDQMLDCGISGDHIFTAPFCTMDRIDLFFSYREEKKIHGKTGRLMSVIGRAPAA